MSFFRNVVLNFKNKDDVEEYLEKYQELVPTQKGVGLEDFFICRLSDTSLLTFCTIDTEENGKNLLSLRIIGDKKINLKSLIQWFWMES